jgi:Helix-turn-helix domain/PASTA domain
MTSRPARTHAQKPQGFGRALEQARVAAGISLDEASTATRISTRYLLALEQEETHELPPPIYARGFLRTYAGYLGLDPAELTSLYPVPYIEPALQPVNSPAPMAPPKSLTYIVAGGIGLIVFLLGVLLLTSGDGGSSATPTDDQGAGILGAGADGAAAPATQDNAAPEIPAAGVIDNYVGQHIDVVRPLLAGIGVTFAEVGVPDAQAAGTVIGQDLEPGTAVDEETAITLTLSTGPAPQ